MKSIASSIIILLATTCLAEEVEDEIANDSNVSSWVGPSITHESGKKLTAGGYTDYVITGEGADRKAEVFTSLTITFDEEDGGIAEQWDYSVTYVCRTSNEGHHCIYFDFQ